MLLLAIYVTMGLLLSAVGFSIDTWQFWCFFGLFWSVSRTARSAGRVEAVNVIVEAMNRLNMNVEKLYKELNK